MDAFRTLFDVIHGNEILPWNGREQNREAGEPGVNDFGDCFSSSMNPEAADVPAFAVTVAVAVVRTERHSSPGTRSLRHCVAVVCSRHSRGWYHGFGAYRHPSLPVNGSVFGLECSGLRLHVLPSCQAPNCKPLTVNHEP